MGGHPWRSNSVKPMLPHFFSSIFSLRWGQWCVDWAGARWPTLTKTIVVVKIIAIVTLRCIFVAAPLWRRSPHHETYRPAPTHGNHITRSCSICICIFACTYLLGRGFWFFFKSHFTLTIRALSYPNPYPLQGLHKRNVWLLSSWWSWPGWGLKCYTGLEGDRWKTCDLHRGFRTCYTKYDPCSIVNIKIQIQHIYTSK